MNSRLYRLSGLLCIVFSISYLCNVSAYPSGGRSGYYAAVLRDANGNPIKVGSSTPYSPKQTCGYAGVNGINCHVDMAKSYGLSSGNIYESDIAHAVHDHGPGSVPYYIPYPLHGVSAAYRVQQGRNIPWGNVQREFYGLSAADSSAGMFGLFCPAYGFMLSDLNASTSEFDQGSYDFAHSSCAICHVGGGQMEYDREGYRYDGGPGIFRSGLNPYPKRGDYYTYDPVSRTIVNMTSEWQSGGVMEIDCLLCHLSPYVTRGGLSEQECIDAGGTWTAGSGSCRMRFHYSMHERNFAIMEEKVPGLAASLGLAGTSALNAVLGIGRRAGDGVNPDISRSRWSWTENYLVNGDEVWFDGVIAASPPKEACSQCHYADKDFMDRGPAGMPMGYTVFQKTIQPGTFDDGDVIGGGRNESDWRIFIPRAGSRKTGESVNDPKNPDAHMDSGMSCTFCHYLLGTSRDYGTDCITCHYDFYGYQAPPEITPVQAESFPALMDRSGRVVQPGVGVLRLDHQFAKGNNRPWGMNMDQLDNTVTCESCHITKGHPNAARASYPSSAHSGFPAFHFERIDCRSCHIPVLNFVQKQTLADFTSSPYQAGERGQYVFNEDGIQYRPLYLVSPTNHDGSGLKIKPTAVLVTSLWYDAERSRYVFLRTVQEAAEGMRDASGDGNLDGIYDWPLNRPQGGDTSLIVNTREEIADMVSRLQSLGVGMPVMKISIDAYSVSHNVAPKSSMKILGSAAGGGCVMCHASSDPSSPNYSTKAAGFFDKTYVLFDQPEEGGNGLVQTEVYGIKRIEFKFKTRRLDGSSAAIELSNSHGEAVANLLRQSDVLGYSATSSPYTIGLMTDPAVAGIPKPYASFSWGIDPAQTLRVKFDAQKSICPGSGCSYTWDFGGTGTSDLSNPVLPIFVYDNPGTYTVKLTISDKTTGLISRSEQPVVISRTAPAPSASATMIVSGMTVTITDSSTDSIDPQDKLSVTVTWGDGTSETKSAGQVFTKTYTSAGTYTINHKVVNTAGMSSSADLSPDDLLTLRAKVTVPVKYSISGRVTRQDGITPIANAAVYLSQGGSTKYITSTKTDGTYTVTGVAAGTYDIVPSKAGYKFTPMNVLVDSDKTDVDFRSVQ